MTASITRWPWTLVLAGLIACTPSFARLDGVLVDAEPSPRLAGPTDLGVVSVTREGGPVPISQNMSINKGDSLATGADGIVVLQLAAGYEIIMDPGTDITIENPSIFVRIGRVLVRSLEQVREALTVRTEIGAAAAEGTEFVVEVPARGRMAVAVLEGRVRVSPRNARWRDTVVFVAGQAGSMDSLEIGRVQPLDKNTIQRIRSRIAEIAGTLRHIVPNVVGLSEAAARAKLEGQGFQVTSRTVMTRLSPVGTVVATSPPEGREWRVGGTIQLEVEEESALVPSVLGQSVTVAARTLAAAGLSLGDTTSAVNADAEEGSVTGMKPKAGSLVRPGTRVSLTIARRATAPAMCQVPPLVGLTEKRARSVLASANLTMGAVRVQESGRTITSQSPAAGARVNCGTKINITIGAVG